MEKNFLQEISRFNSDFSLRGNRETLRESRTHTEILDLERELEALYKGHEMPELVRQNFCLSAVKVNSINSQSCICLFFPSEMELMSSNNSQLSSMQKEKRRLQLELQVLDTSQTGEYHSFIS